jgi:hypothetical protein
MSHINHVASQPASGMSRETPVSVHVPSAAERLYASRIAQAEAAEAGFDAGVLISPVLIILSLTGWLFSTLAILYVLAPLAGAAFLLIDHLRPSTPTEAWHGR